MMSQNKWDILTKLYINRGLKIFPVVTNGKTPAIQMWQKDCSSDSLQVLYWLENIKTVIGDYQRHQIIYLLLI